MATLIVILVAGLTTLTYTVITHLSGLDKDEKIDVNNQQLHQNDSTIIDLNKELRKQQQTTIDGILKANTTLEQAVIKLEEANKTQQQVIQSQKETINQITGGDAYPMVLLRRLRNNRLLVEVGNPVSKTRGHYTLPHIVVNLVDVNRFNELQHPENATDNVAKYQTSYTINYLPSGSLDIVGDLIFDMNKTDYDYNAFLYVNNNLYVQQIHLRIKAEKIEYATIVRDKFGVRVNTSHSDNFYNLNEAPFKFAEEPIGYMFDESNKSSSVFLKKE